MATLKPKLHHVTMKTSHMAEMIVWYGTVVGASVQFRNENAAWMTNDDANHRVAFLSVPGLDDDPHKVNHNGMHHSAYEYDSFGDLIATYDRLKGEQILPAFCLDHGLTISLYYQDPEGNYVELQSDNFGDWAMSSDFIRTSTNFASNPIGTFFDADKVLQAHKAGTPFNELQPAIRAGKYLPATIPGIGLPV